MTAVHVATPSEVLGLDPLPPTLTVQQTAKLLQVSKQTIYRAIEDGELHSFTVRNRSVVATRPLMDALGWGVDREQDN